MTEIINNSTPAISFLQQVTENVIRLPALQRDFVWGDNNAKDLFDSIYRDFPIGNFYIWSPPKLDSDIPISASSIYESENVHKHATSIAGSSTDNLPNTKAKYILDGQQRITTLYRIYNKVEGTNVYFDPKNEKFLAGGISRLYSLDYPTRNRKKNSVVSVHEVWNTSQKNFDDIWSQSPFTVEEKQKIKKLNKILNQFKVDIHELRDHSLDQVIEIFKRINKTGKSLTWAESLAMPSLVKSVPSIKNDIERLRKDLNLHPDMSKIITIDFIAQSIIWCMDGYTKEVNQSYDKEDIKKAFFTISIGLKEVLDILDKTFNIKTKNMVGSGVPIIISSIAAGKTIISKNSDKKHNEILTGILSLNKYHLSDNERDRIGLYYIASTTFGTYSQGASLQADKKTHISLIVDSAENHCSILFNLANEILELAKKKAHDGNNFINKNELYDVHYTTGKRSPYFILLGIILAKENASNFITESHEIDFSNSHRHHIYPHSQISGLPLRHSIGNITYISETVNQEISNKLPNDYLKNNFKPSKLKKHLFPDSYANDIAKMDKENANDFIKDRTEEIKRSFNNFIYSLIENAK